MSILAVKSNRVTALVVAEGRLRDALAVEYFWQGLGFLEDTGEFVLFFDVVGALLLGVQGFVYWLDNRRIFFKGYGRCVSSCWPVSCRCFRDQVLLRGNFPLTDLTGNKVGYTDLTSQALVQVRLMRDRLADERWVDIWYMFVLSLITKWGANKGIKSTLFGVWGNSRYYWYRTTLGYYGWLDLWSKFMIERMANNFLNLGLASLNDVFGLLSRRSAIVSLACI